ncbi:hypothetical protein FB45DRAFT_1086256 [Roridomyces roridus]|uniref:Uncharacterized protein n=1 Tax=Roridomyces roridus TaxID=1738132 RepID=A0AAD7BLS7_9AGAR|nr:hypothetical protein FB45DRAFT_1086256 [Roridomyces roridus]
MALPSVRSRDPRLPLDLERTVFEISALSHPRKIPNLMLVSHRVKSWVEPMMYRVVVLGSYLPTAHDLPMLTYDIFSRLLVTRPPDFFTKAVTLVVDLFDFRGTSMAAWESLECLQRIVINTATLFPVPSPTNFSHQAFRAVTHLEIFDEAAEQTIAGIAHIPHLTHFAFNDADLSAYLSSSVFPACSRLKCIVLLHEADMYRVETLLDVTDAFVRARQTGRVTDISAFISNEDMSWLLKVD